MTALLFWLLTVFAVRGGKCDGIRFLSAVTGQVRKENYFYYSMMYEGTILLELTSLTGDCDLYVSQKTSQPTYETFNNCLQSNTCGLDSVIIPKRWMVEAMSFYKTLQGMAHPGHSITHYIDRKNFRRPVGIGVFGHPSHDTSEYILTFTHVNDSLDLFHSNPYESFELNQDKKKKRKATTTTTTKDRDTDSEWGDPGHVNQGRHQQSWDLGGGGDGAGWYDAWEGGGGGGGSTSEEKLLWRILRHLRDFFIAFLKKLIEEAFNIL